METGSLGVSRGLSPDGVACVPSSSREIDEARAHGCVLEGEENDHDDGSRRGGADEDECCDGRARSRDDGGWSEAIVRVNATMKRRTSRWRCGLVAFM